MKFIIADDSPFGLRQLRHLLGEEKDYHIVAEESTPEGLLSAAMRFSPDFIITDIAMGRNLRGLDIAIQIKEQLPATRIICITMHNISEWIYQMQLVGISGYVYKTTRLDNLKEAIRFAMEGRFYVDRPIVLNLLNEIKRLKDRSELNAELTTAEQQELLVELDTLLSKTKGITDINGFMPNERQQLLLSATVAGHKVDEIAKMLSVSTRQLSNIKRELFDLTETQSTPELIAIAQRAGWI